MRQLSEGLFLELKSGILNPVLLYVQNDDTLDMEFRGRAFSIYYRGGLILSVSQEANNSYSWYGLDEKYHIGYSLKHDPKEFTDYLPEAKHIIDQYICTADKNHLGEKEIQQLVVKENNYSPVSNDTDFFIADMEYEEGHNRFDLIAIRWDSTTQARKSNRISLAIIEVKQGIHSVKSSSKTPGLRKHQKDFFSFIAKGNEAKLDVFRDDMLMIFKQKCELNLIRANHKIKSITRQSDIAFKSKEIDFICLLTNYKQESRNLQIESIGMEDCKYIHSSFIGYGLYARNIIVIHPKYKNMSEEYRNSEKSKQLELYNTGFFGKASNGGYWNKLNEKREKVKISRLPFILKPSDSKSNLYKDIQDKTIEYFETNNITWWRQEEDDYFPSGHLVSSQIHCLNHLFALQQDKDAIRYVIENATGMHFDEVLLSLIDKNTNSFISFEFALDNDILLGENDKGAKRGVLCTSIDAMVRARQGDKIWYIPIEWKYTETYKRKDKTNLERLSRYSKLIQVSDRLKMPIDGVPHSVYFIEPNYELMRQTLLCEQLVRRGDAHDFFHLNIIPTANKELRAAVENEFLPMLKEPTKFKIIDPQELLMPLEGDEKYKPLFNYLRQRYW